jgi:class 3 adenylate cyclase
MSARQERKVVTVLFADLVGFTARAEEMDPEDVAALLAGYHSRVKAELERFGGTVEKFIGDAVMAVFGAPLAHEDDPERAVRAGLAIRDWAEEEGIELRIGVNTGEALVTLDAEPLAAGDVVNTAARLQSAARPGSVLVGEKAHEATAAVIEYRDAPPVEAKGKARPVPVWEAERARARVAVERLHGATLVGRARELEQLSNAFARAREEHRPQLVTLVGVPGIGKSRLVFELFKQLEQGQELVFWRHGRCLPYGDGVTFWALAEIVKAQAGILETDSADDAEAKLAAVAPEEWMLPHLRALVGLGSASDTGDREEAFAAWRQLFESMAEQRPLVLVVEDLHWADDNLLDFVDYLADWASGVPLLVVATARPELLERRPAWGGGKANASTVSLVPLSEDETAKLIGQLLERPVLPVEDQGALLARAGGNPLYAEQFARLLRERGDLEELPLPENVQGIIASRLDLLDPAEKALLQDAAVLGRTFWAGGVTFVSSGQPRQVADRLHALERKEFLRRERQSTVADETQYTFLHVLVRDVAYGQIPRAQRAEKHRLAAEWIESLGRPEDHAEMLAHHFVSALELARAAGRPTDELEGRTRLALRDAGDRALALHAKAAAARFYNAALELWPPDDGDRPHLLYRYGAAAYDLDALLEARDELLGSGDRETAALAESELALVRWYRGERDLSTEHTRRAAELLADAPLSRAKAEVAHQLARDHMLGGEFEAALEHGREALAMSEALGLPGLRASALATTASACFHLGDLGGISDLERAAALAAEADAFEVVRVMTNLGASLFVVGELERAYAIQEEARRRARRFGSPRDLRFLEDHWSEQLYWSGRWDECEEVCSRRIAESEAGAPDYLVSSFHCYRALIRLARADGEGALADVRAGLETGRGARDSQILEPAFSESVRVLFGLGHRPEARELCEEALAAWTGVRPQSADLCWVARPLGLEQAFLDALDRYRLATRWKDAARAVVQEEYVRAAEVFAEIGSRPDEALARLRAAEAGEPGQLEPALAFWRSVGATRYIREGEALLAATA